MKYILLILILLPLSASAIFYQQDGFETYGDRETGLVFNTPEKNSFSIFIGEDFGTFGMEKEPTDGWRETECIMVRDGKQDECSLQEFSILFYNFPKEFIEGLGI